MTESSGSRRLGSERFIGLLIPAMSARIAAALGGVISVVCAVGVLVAGFAGLVVGPILAWGAGLLLSSAVRRGVWARADHLEVRYVASEHRFRLEHIDRIHIAPHASGVGVETGGCTYVFIEHSGLGVSAEDAQMSRLRGLAGRVREIVEYDDAKSFVAGTRQTKQGGPSVAGVFRASRRPLVIAVFCLYSVAWVTAVVAAVG